MEALEHIRTVFAHNLLLILEGTFVWILVIFGNVKSLDAPHPDIEDAMPYLRLLSILLACCVSLLTLIKLYRELKK